MISNTVNNVTIEPKTMLTVVGDLHGQWEDLMTIFNMNGLPSDQNRVRAVTAAPPIAPPRHRHTDLPAHQRLPAWISTCSMATLWIVVPTRWRSCCCCSPSACGTRRQSTLTVATTSATPRTSNTYVLPPWCPLQGSPRRLRFCQNPRDPVSQVFAVSLGTPRLRARRSFGLTVVASAYF